MSMTLQIRSVRGLDIRCAQAGDGHPETVLLTSPWPESLLAFRGIWDQLAERFELHAIDLPGFGQSDIRPELYSPPAMASFLIELVTDWELAPVHLVAPDVGTAAALHVALDAPEVLRSLAIGGGATAFPLQVGGVLKDIIGAPDLDAFRAVDSRDLLGATFDAMPGGPPPAEVREDYLRSYAGSRFVESCAYVRTYPQVLPELAERLASILTPTQIVHGRDDELVPTPNQQFLRDRLPHSRMDLLPAQHFAWEETPALYADVLTRWIGGGYRDPLGDGDGVGARAGDGDVERAP
jgi:pimeloyl-ACP methyl ester carboxylesterase